MGNLLHLWVTTLTTSRPPRGPPADGATHTGVSSRSGDGGTTATFWHDIERVRQELPSLSLVPPPSLLEKLQQAPFRGGLEPVDADQGVPWQFCEIAEGALPSDLHGCLCRNGPGRIRLPCGEAEEKLYQYGHWFDGDGLVTRLTLHPNGTATFVGSYVQTERFQAQQRQGHNRGFAKAGAWTKRGTGRWWENVLAIATNPANTNVLFLASKNSDDSLPSLYAIAEGGDPVPLSLSTLETIGAAQPFTSTSGKERCRSFFSAHYSRDYCTRHIYNHGVNIGPDGASVNIMECSADGTLLRQQQHPLPYLTFIHDNAVSENYLLVIQQPFAAPVMDFGEQLSWDTSTYQNNSIAMVFSKKTLECVAEIDIGPVSTYHLIDAFESSDGQNVALRLACHSDPKERNYLEDCFKDLYSARRVPACELHEFVLDMATRTLVSKRHLVPDALPFELPETNSAYSSYRKRFVYNNCRLPDDDFLNSLQKVDLDTGTVSDRITFGENVVAGAPLFVPKPTSDSDGTVDEEDHGYVFVPLYRANDHKSDISILDAQSLRTVARLRLASHVPYQFHGAWWGGALD